MRRAHLYCIRIGYLTSKLDTILFVSTTPPTRCISYVRPCFRSGKPDNRENGNATSFSLQQSEFYTKIHKNAEKSKIIPHMLAYVEFFSNNVTSRAPTRLHRPTSKLLCSTAASNNYLPKFIKNVNIFLNYCQKRLIFMKNDYFIRNN